MIFICLLRFISRFPHVSFSALYGNVKIILGVFDPQCLNVFDNSWANLLGCWPSMVLDMSVVGICFKNELEPAEVLCHRWAGGCATGTLGHAWSNRTGLDFIDIGSKRKV